MQPFLMSEVGAAVVLPPREITVSQWADENRVLTGAAAAERGQWHTRPYQCEPMDVLSPSHPCRQVVLWSAAQIASILFHRHGITALRQFLPLLVDQQGKVGECR